MRILFDAAPPAAGGGAPPAVTPPNQGTPPAGGATPWYDSLPPDLKGDARITSLKDVGDLAKGYVNAQTLIGAKRVVVPGDKATPEEKAAFYNTIGRPETPDKYSPPTVKPIPGVNIDQAAIAAAAGKFHELGLTDAQQRGVMDYYLSGINDTTGRVKQSMESGKAAAESALRNDWGREYDANIEIARGALRQFGDVESMQEIEAGLGNNPALVKMFHKIGKSLAEDTSRTGTPFAPAGSAAAAMQKISELKTDRVFQEALNSTSNPGHRDAVALWTETHRRAFPSKPE